MSFDAKSNEARVKVVAYARCSKLLNQDPTTQLVHIREFCRARNYDLIEEFIDFGISGSQERRPALDKMMMNVSRGKYRIVITAALDRISRSTKHFLTIFEELKHNNVSIISLRENLDFTSPVGQMVATILSSIATLEKSIISERIRQSLAARKLAAQQTGSSWRCGRPPVDVSIVNQVSILRTKGVSIRQIAKQLGLGRTTVSRIVAGPKPSKNGDGNAE